MDARETWDTYTATWKLPERSEKLEQLRECLHEGGVYRDPLAEARNHEEVANYMMQFDKQVPGGHFETTYFLFHHQRSIARWNMRSGDGAVISQGLSYAEYGDDGMLSNTTAFFETPDGE